MHQELLLHNQKNGPSVGSLLMRKVVYCVLLDMKYFFQYKLYLKDNQ